MTYSFPHPGVPYNIKCCKFEYLQFSVSNSFTISLKELKLISSILSGISFVDSKYPFGLIKFKDQITSQQFQKLTDGAYNLQAIPVVEQLNFTDNISPEGLGKGYTHSLTMKFKTANDRDSVYLPHPIHKKFVDYFLPLTESVLVYDFWE